MVEFNYEKWAQDVESERITTCKIIKDVVARYRFDVANQNVSGYYLDEPAGKKAIHFICNLKQTKGEWAGRPLQLTGWQQFLVFNIFGWKRADGTRRFRKVYIRVGRKNGKSTLAAAIGLYLLFADNEPRAEIYSAATTKDQAKIVFEEAKQMVRNCALKTRIDVFRNSLVNEPSASFFQPVSSDYDTLDGLNPQGVIIDEFHAHPTTGILDIFQSGMGSRRQPLEFIITSAGFNKNYPCYAFEKNAINVIRRITEDNELFAMIFTLDDNDDWTDEKNWIKANPNLGISVSYDYMCSQVKDARNRPEAQINVKTKNLGIWTDAAKTWILDEKWMECCGETRDLKGCDCWGALDLATVSDIAPFVLLFNEDDKLQYLPFFWIPEDSLKQKIKKENVNYMEWVNKGLMKMTPGNVIDYDFIAAEVQKLSEIYNIQSIAYDRWNSSQCVINLQNMGMTMNPFGQGYGSMSTPTKQFEVDVLSKKIEHFGNPVLRWMMSNTVVTKDPAGNIKPDKSKSSQKIDGIVAAIMARGEMMNSINNQDAYAAHGLRTV